MAVASATASWNGYVDEMIAHVAAVDRAIGALQRGVTDGPRSAETADAARRLRLLAEEMPIVPRDLTWRRRQGSLEVREWYGAAVARLAVAAEEALAEGVVDDGSPAAERVGRVVEGAITILHEVQAQIAELAKLSGTAA